MGGEYIGKTLEEAQKKVDFQNEEVSNRREALISFILIFYGMLFCAIFIGVIIGVPMIILGIYKCVKIRRAEVVKRKSFNKMIQR